MSSLSTEYTTDFIQQLLDKLDALTFLVTEQATIINKLKEELAILREENVKLKE